MSDYPSPLALALDAPECPPQLAHAVAAREVWAWGDLGILSRPLLGLFCSVRCPGEAILRAHDLTLALREAGIPVVGGFHSPVERECLRMLLRGGGPVVICPARGLERMRVPPEWREPLRQGRLLLLSPFGAGTRRATTAQADARNRFAAALARAVCVIYAQPGGRTERIAHDLSRRGIPLATVAAASSEPLAALGAVVLTLDAVREWWSGVIASR